MNPTMATVLGYSLGSRKRNYQNYLDSLRVKKHELISSDYDTQIVEELMKIDPEGILEIIYKATNEQLAPDKKRKVWQSAVKMLPNINRKDLEEIAYDRSARLYYENFMTNSEEFNHFIAMMKDMWTVWRITPKASNKIQHEFAQKYLNP